ncbi:MAG: DUF3052 domain-containing protein [Thermoplasmata archaeon]|nr:DUF3052 domain-containing protein [Thermoplasmata archaeon]
MGGYSGTPLAKKLGFRAGARVVLLGVPQEVKDELANELAHCRRVERTGDAIDLAMIFAPRAASLNAPFARCSQRLAPAGMLWICWLKRRSGKTTDLDEATVRAYGSNAGLVDVKVCAVSETWSGLKFVVRLRDRPNRR